MAITISRQARSLIYQNFGLAVVYNLIAVPVAVAGYATPLVAAIAMSGSSCLVIANALRLNLPSARRRLPQKFTAVTQREGAHPTIQTVGEVG